MSNEIVNSNSKINKNRSNKRDKDQGFWKPT